jgi:hypothetical protein
MKLTAAVAALALPEGVVDFVWGDDQVAGFVASWIYQFRFRRQSRRMTAKAAAVPASAARARSAADARAEHQAEPALTSARAR